MPTASELIIRVRTDGTGQARAELVNLDRQIDQTGQTAGKSAGKFGSLKQGIDQLSPVALGATGAIVGLGLGAKAAVDASISWESALAGVAKTLDSTGLSAEEFDAAVQDIGAALREMATEIPVSAVELAGIAEAAGQLGIARGDVVEFTRTMAELGVATNLTSTQAAESFARFTNITGGAIDDIDNLASALVDLGNNSATTESEILDMAMRIAAAGTQAGFSQEEILGMAAAMSSMGLEAEAGGTAMSRVLLEIQSAVIDGGESLSQFAQVAGMSAESFAAAWRANPQEALIGFLTGLREIEQSGGNTTAILDELQLGGIRVGDSVRRASGNVELFAGSMERANTASAEGNALQEETARRFETAASEMQVARNSANELAIVVGDGLTPGLVTLAQAGGETALVVADLAVVLRDATQAIQDFSLAEIGGVSVGPMTNLDLLGAGLGFVRGEVQKNVDGLQELTTWLGITDQAHQDAAVGVSIFGAVTAGIRDDIAQFSTVYGPTYAEYLRVVQQAAVETEELSATVETWLALQAESQARWEGSTAPVQDQTQALAENELALSGLVDTTTMQGAAAIAAAQENAEYARILYDVESAASGLAGAFEAAGAAAGIFNAQSSTFTGIANNLQGAYDAILERKERGVELSAEEEAFLERYPELAARQEGAMADAAIQAGLWAAAQTEVMLAQDAVHRGAEDAPQKLGNAARAIQEAANASGIMTDAQRDLLESILNVGVGLDGLNGQEANIAVNLLEGAGEHGAGQSGPTRFEQRAEDLGITGRVKNIGSSLTDLDGSTAEVTATVDDTDARSDLEWIESTKNRLAGSAFTITGYVDTSQIDAAIAYIDRNLPHSPAEEGPLSREPNWAWLFQSVPIEAEKAVDWAMDAFRRLQGDFLSDGGIAEIMTGESMANLEEDKAALEAYMMALIEAGFSNDSPQFIAAAEAYAALMQEIEILTGIAGTEAAQEFWEQWERENAERQYPEQAAREAADNIWRSPGWEDAGIESGGAFFGAFGRRVGDDMKAFPAEIATDPAFRDGWGNAGEVAGQTFADTLADALHAGLEQSQQQVQDELMDLLHGGDGSGPGGSPSSSPGGGGGGGGSVPLDSGDYLFAPELDAALSVSGLSDGAGRLLTLESIQRGIDVSDWLTMILKEFGTDHSSVVLRYPGALDPDDLAEVQAIMAWLDNPFKSPGTFPEFATGGYITGEGMAMLHPNEYITPDRSIPQLAQEIVGALRGGMDGMNGNQPINVVINLDSQTIANKMHRSTVPGMTLGVDA